MFKWWGFIVSVSLAACWFFCAVSPVSAQDPSETPTITPTPTTTPTPAYQHSAYTSDGVSTVLVENRITTGDIAIVVALGLVALIQLGQAFIIIPKLWFLKNEH